MLNRSLFLAIVLLSTLSARSSSAAESTPAQDKAQGKPQAKTQAQKPAAVEVKSQPAPVKPQPDKNVKEATSKTPIKTTNKTTNVTGVATVKAVSEKAPEKNVKSIKKIPGSALVPPPPPDTPTLMGMPEGDFDSLASLEYMSLSAMKERHKQLNTQLLDAQQELKSRQGDAEEVKSKAKQFEALYSEGVISKHELEVAQKDANEVDSRIGRAKMRVEDLQSNINRLNDRLKDQERRVAKVRKKTSTTKSKLAKSKNIAPKAADKTVDKATVKAADKAGAVKPGAIQTPVKSEQPVKNSPPSGENKIDDL